jgi:hypothetical protein
VLEPIRKAGFSAQKPFGNTEVLSFPDRLLVEDGAVEDHYMLSNRWRHVTPAHPCPVCGRPDWCSLSADGTLAACRRVEAGA